MKKAIDRQRTMEKSLDDDELPFPSCGLLLSDLRFGMMYT